MSEEDRKDPPNGEPSNELAWIIIIALFICLLLLSGYGFMVIYEAFVKVLTGSVGSLTPPHY